VSGKDSMHIQGRGNTGENPAGQGFGHLICGANGEDNQGDEIRQGVRAKLNVRCV